MQSYVEKIGALHRAKDLNFIGGPNYGPVYIYISRKQPEMKCSECAK